MRRREFIALLGGAAAWPLEAGAQQAKVYTIGVLTLTRPNPGPLLKALREGLRDVDYIEGHNLRLEIRSAPGSPDLQFEKAAELVRLRRRSYRHILHPSRGRCKTGHARHTNCNGRCG